MSRFIKKSYIDDLTNNIDFPELVGQYTELKKSGRSYSGLCCFHDEKSPSLSVSSDGKFHCFGCNAGGAGGIDFIKQVHNLQFSDAVHKLAKVTGFRDVEYDSPRENSGPPKKPTGLARQALSDSVPVYQTALAKHTTASSYLARRGFTPQDVATFEVGFAPDDFNFITGHFRGTWGRPILVDAGLAVQKEGTKKYWDRFRKRVMFPVRDAQGNIVGYGGRLLSADKAEQKKLGKYYNSPQSTIYDKSQILYGLYQYLQAPPRERGVINVIEGYTDVISCHRHGFTNTVGTMGTSLTEQHVKFLKRYGGDHVRLIFDGDNAGLDAAYRAIMTALPMHKSGQSIGVVLMPRGEDPDSLLSKLDGQKQFEALLSAEMPASQFLFAYLKRKHPGDTPEARSFALSEAKQLINKISDRDLQTQFSNEAEKQFGCNIDILGKNTSHKSKLSNEHKALIENSSPELVRFCSLVLAEHSWLALESLPVIDNLTSEESDLVQFVEFTTEQVEKGARIFDLYQGELLELVRHLSTLTPSDLPSQIKTIAAYRDWHNAHFDASQESSERTHFAL